MQSDFFDSHNRHLSDALSLYRLQRWANADHLFGLAAECGLKRLMIAFGIKTDNDGTPEGKYKIHINKLWGKYDTVRTGHNQGVGYALSSTNPFRIWDISDRYGSQSNFDQERVDQHRLGAEEVDRLIKRARKDGLL